MLNNRNGQTMRKIAILLFFVWATSISVFAQTDCNMCGTWIGSWNEQILNKNTNELEWNRLKKYVRIDKYGDEYKIRIKYENLDHGYSNYVNDECSIVYADESLIRFQLAGKTTPSYDANGISGYDKVIRTYELQYKNGYCHLTIIAQQHYDYDRNKNFIKQWDGLPYVATSEENNMDLYKEDNVW